MNNNCKGQALIESVIAIGTVLIVVVTLLPLLAKFIEVRQSTDQAARYMAWERTVWFQQAPKHTSHAATKSNAELEREIHWRFFSDDKNVLSSEDSSAQKKWKIEKNINPMLGTWQTTNNEFTSLMYNEKSNQSNEDKVVTANVVESGTPGLSGRVGGILSAIDFGGFSVNQKGYYGSSVAYKLAELPGILPFDGRFEFNTNSQLYLIGDGWNTSGRDHSVKMVRGLTPSAALDMGFLNKVRNVLGFLPVAREMRTSWLELGKVDTEQVPEQRLCRVSGNRCR